MLVLPNMGLVKWENINDNFSHEQLASNFSLLDEHDHTAGKGKQIPFGGLAEQSVGASNLRSGLLTEIAANISSVTWFTPTKIVTEQSRESTAFGTLTTADEVKNVVVTSTSQLLGVGYTALAKASVSGAGRVAIFIGSNQLKYTNANTAPVVQEVSLTTTIWNMVNTAPLGLTHESLEGGAFVTTGQALTANGSGGLCYIFGLPVGNYTISVQYKSTSGNVTAKERSLAVARFG